MHFFLSKDNGAFSLTRFIVRIIKKADSLLLCRHILNVIIIFFYLVKKYAFNLIYSSFIKKKDYKSE